MRIRVEERQRRLHLGAGVNAVAIATLIYLVANGLIVGRPWWLVVGAALAVPELTLGALAGYRGLRAREQVSGGAGRRATRTLCGLGMMLLVLGVAFSSP